jgi:hypothetical protein
MSEPPHLLTEVTEDGVLIAALNRSGKLDVLSDETMGLKGFNGKNTGAFE